MIQIVDISGNKVEDIKRRLKLRCGAFGRMNAFLKFKMLL